MNSTTFLIILIVILAAVVVYFFMEKKRIKGDFEALQNKSEALQAEKDNFFKEATTLRVQNESLENQLKGEKDSLETQKIELREHLTLLGKDLVSTGSKTLKSESESKLMELLRPFKEKLESFEKEVKDNSKREMEEFSNMRGIVKTLSDQHDKMKTTAQNLVDALRGENKTQGDWGEMALQKILENSGLVKGVEYETQSSYKDEENNNLRPDVVILLPDDKQLIIDSKVSLLAYERYVNAEEKAEKDIALKDHINSIKTHIKQLGDKDYSHLEGLNSPEFVLLFIPLESSFSLAVREEPGLYQMAFDKKIVLVTPSTLLATLKTVESIWKNERTTRNTLEISRQAGAMYDKFVGFVGDLEKVGKKQNEAQLAYDEAVKKLSVGKGNLVNSAQKLKKLGLTTKKELDKKLLGDDDDLD